MKLIKDILISLSVIFCLIICVSCKSDNHINKREKTINDIAIAEEIIVKTFDSCSKEDNIKRFRPRGNKEASYEEVLSGETNLSGTFSFYERDVEAFMKVSSEPLSYSFALLEFFIQNGLPETDFSGKCYFDTYSHVIGINDEMSYIKITLLTDDILAIDYGRYHMIIGEDEGISFVFSYCYDSNQLTDYLDKLDFQYSILLHLWLYWTCYIHCFLRVSDELFSIIHDFPKNEHFRDECYALEKNYNYHLV